MGTEASYGKMGLNMWGSSTRRRGGSGKQIWESGKYYIGEWKNGHPEGKGVLVDPNLDSEGDGKDITIGVWGKNGLIKELVVGNNSMDTDVCQTDDVPVFESLRTSWRLQR